MKKVFEFIKSNLAVFIIVLIAIVCYVIMITAQNETINSDKDPMLDAPVLFFIQ